MSAKVLNSAKDGGGDLQAATACLGDEAFRAFKPKVLIWEVLARFFLTNLDAESKWLEKLGLRS